jgi:hypothetical protein
MNNQKRAEIISVTHSPEQEMVLGPILDRHAVQSGVAGLLGIVSRSYRSEEGRVTLPAFRIKGKSRFSARHERVWLPAAGRVALCSAITLALVSMDNQERARRLFRSLPPFNPLVGDK